MFYKVMYDVDLLYEVGKTRGFKNDRSLREFLRAKLRYPRSDRQFYDLIRHGYLTFSKMLLIADALHMTDAEVKAVFLSAIFKEAGDGHHAMLSDERREWLLAGYHNPRYKAQLAGRELAIKRRKEKAEKGDVKAQVDKFLKETEKND